MAKLLETKFGGELVFHEGFSYTKFRVNTDRTVSWRCKRKCGGWLRQNGKEFVVTKEHNGHTPSPIEESRGGKTSNKKRAVSNPHERPSVVLDEVLKNFDLNAKPSMPLEQSSKTQIARLRRKEFGSNLSESEVQYVSIPETLKFSERGENFILDDQKGPERIIILATIKNIEELSLCSIWFCDGTFKSCPKGFEQVYTIHGLRESWVHPYVYALLPNRKHSTYIRLLEVVTSTVRGVVVTPEIIICDFEQSFIKAVSQVLPTTDVQGCLYHLTQSIGRNLPLEVKQDLRGGDTSLELLLKQLPALAFLPPIKVESAFYELQAKALQKYPQTGPLVGYFKRTYIGDKFCGPKFSISLWSVYFRVQANFPRTNNAVEGWNNRLNNKTNCSHPSLFSILKVIRCEQSRMEESAVLRNAGEVPKKRAKYADLDVRIKNLVTEFDKGYKDPMEFLEGMAHNLLDIKSLKRPTTSKD